MKGERPDRRIVCFVLAMLMLAGCASLRPQFQTPVVSVRSVELAPSEGLSPRFRIHLHVVNPNRSPLPLQGLFYSISLEGHRVLSGVSSELPVIDSWGEGDVVVVATADLLGSIRLISELLSERRQSLSYELNATLDIGSLVPALKITDRGEISLQPEGPAPDSTGDHSASST